MSIQDLGSVGEFVAAIATIATLIYLAIEVRRNTAATRSAAHQAQVDSTVGLHAMLANDPDIAGLILKANGDLSSLSPEDNLRLQYFYISHFNLWHSAYWNKNEGLLSEHVWSAWDKAMTLVLKNQLACRQAWAQTAEIYDRDFQSHVFKIISAVEVDVGRNQGWGH
jgi:hypothetical protein